MLSYSRERQHYRDIYTHSKKSHTLVSCHTHPSLSCYFLVAGDSMVFAMFFLLTWMTLGVIFNYIYRVITAPFSTCVERVFLRGGKSHNTTSLNKHVTSVHKITFTKHTNKKFAPVKVCQVKQQWRSLYPSFQGHRLSRRRHQHYHNTWIRLKLF